MKKRNTPFPFMKLPGEIRNRIYKMAVVEAKTIDTTGLFSEQKCNWNGHRYIGAPSNGLETALTLKLTSRAVGNEAAAMFFRENTFYCCLASFGGGDFLRMINPLERQILRSLEICMDFSTGKRHFSLLRKCTGLRQLSLEFGNCSVLSVHDNVSLLASHSKIRRMAGMNQLMCLRGLKEVEVHNQDYCYRCRLTVGCPGAKELERLIRECVTKPRSQASVRAQIIHDTPNLWKELKAEEKHSKARITEIRKRKREDDA